MKTHNVQQRTEEWFHLRKGKITGTGLKAIMGTPYARDQYLYELLAEHLMVGVEDNEENAMDRGLRLEPQAIAAFEFETGKKVSTVGFAEDDDDPAIANSPDGLIGDTEAVEVKCLAAKNHIRTWFENEVPKDHYWQAIQYFVVNNKLEILHFVSYHPDIPVHPLHIIEVKRADVADDIKEARVAQEKFLGEIKKKLDGVVEEI